jgi:hypothetical protein
VIVWSVVAEEAKERVLKAESRTFVVPTVFGTADD